MTNTKKRSLYESIMNDVSKTVKSHINNGVFENAPYSNLSGLNADGLGKVAYLVAAYARLWQQGDTDVCTALMHLANEALENETAGKQITQLYSKISFSK